MYNVNQKVVGWDVDGILADFIGAFYNHFGKPRPEYNEFKEWGFPFVSEHFHKVENDIGFWLGIEPYPMYEKYKAAMVVDFYITARPIEAKFTRLWLAMNGFQDKPVLSVGSHTSKVAAAKMTGITDFIDDSIKNVRELRGIGVNAVLHEPREIDYSEQDIEVSSTLSNLSSPFFKFK